MKLWIKYLEEDEATGILAELYDRGRKAAPSGRVPDNLKVLSVRPELAVAKENMRRTVLGDTCSLGTRIADMISVVVSGMNDCRYCGTAHANNLVKQHSCERDDAIGLYLNWRSVELPEKERVMLEFVEKLNYTPGRMVEEDVQRLREAGYTDANICDIVALTAYRNFMNRLHDGLGLSPDNLRGRLGDEFVDAFARE